MKAIVEVFLILLNVVFCQKFTTTNPDLCRVLSTCDECIEDAECLWCANGTYGGFCLPIRMNYCPLTHAKWKICWLYMDLLQVSLVLLCLFSVIICILLIFACRRRGKLRSSKRRGKIRIKKKGKNRYVKTGKRIHPKRKSKKRKTKKSRLKNLII